MHKFSNRNLMKLISFVLILSLFVLGGCTSSKKSENSTENTAADSTAEATEARYDDVEIDGIVTDLMKDMSLEEMVGQMFIVYTDSLDYNAETAITDKMKENLKKYQPGGVIFFSFNLDTREQISAFLSDISSCTTLAPFLAVDEEGGEVARIANNENMGTTKFPSMSEIGSEGDTEKAYEVGETIGKEISELGFNLDFAPVADIKTSETNEEIGTRSFGSEEALVSKMVPEVVKGLQDNGVSATLKHFPGQGALDEDTHKGYANLKRNIDELRDVEFKPFKAGIKADTDLVMMSHESVSTVTETNTPASLSSLMVTDILRNELRYDNIIITDAMNMNIITKFYDSDEAAVKAIKAGCDIVLMPDDFETAYQGVIDAVDEGKISEKRIKESVRRILNVKLKRGIIDVILDDY